MNYKRTATRLWLLSLAVLASGFLVLLGYTVAEVSAHPGISLVDAFWIGRLPWTPIGVGLILGGATATLVFGGAVTLLGAPWPLQLPVHVGLVAGTLWWIYALILGGGAYSCAPPCAGGRPIPDVITIAYSSPNTVIVLLLIPTLGASLLAGVSLRLRPAGRTRSDLPLEPTP